MSQTVAVLYCDPKGVYSTLPGVELWDEKRDARLYAGPHPVVAHPPCGPWGMLAPINQARYGHQVGDDGRCFLSALESVRRWGGVLEHPAETKAWARYGLDRPPRMGWARSTWDDGWVCAVSQAAYGHRARKLTWLYYFGKTAPPALRWERPAPTACVSYLKNHRPPALPRLTKKHARATPLEFAKLLLGIARGEG